MSKFIVAVFENEKAAYEGSQAMLDLHRDGNIAVFAGAVITKDANGVVNIEDAVDEGPAGTATGMLVGTLIGALGGAAGAAAGASAGAAAATMAAGMTGGTLAGWYSDLYSVGVDGQFLSDVGDLMEPGKSAVVAEVEEGWTAPLDARMEELGGTVFRRYRIDVEDAQIEREIEAANRELDELEEELNQAADETEEAIQERVDAAKARLRSLQDRAAAKVDSLNAEAEAKVSKLNDQIATAKVEAKAKFEKARDQIQADYEVRAQKLSEAAQLTKEALT